MLGVLGSVAQFERAIMRERQAEGIERAKARRKGSRRLTDVNDMVFSLYAGGTIVRDIAHHMGTAMRADTFMRRYPL